MAALDTNVLVRLLVEDDVAQLAAAQKLIGKILAASETLYVPVTVAIELEWVLRAGFGFDKSSVSHALSSLLSAAELSFQSAHAVEIALRTYTEGSADFSDCLHVALARAADEHPLWTFDKAASKVDGAKLLAAR